MRRSISRICLVLGLLGCSDSTGPADDLEGLWNLVGYSDAGTPAVATGTAEFRGNGTFAIEGTLTFPGEPADSISVTGTWSGRDDVVTLRTGGTTGRWVVTTGSGGVVMTLEGSQPPTTMTLMRPGP